MRINSCTNSLLGMKTLRSCSDSLDLTICMSCSIPCFRICRIIFCSYSTLSFLVLFSQPQWIVHYDPVVMSKHCISQHHRQTSALHGAKLFPGSVYLCSRILLPGLWQPWIPRLMTRELPLTDSQRLFPFANQGIFISVIWNRAPYSRNWSLQNVNAPSVTNNSKWSCQIKAAK